MSFADFVIVGFLQMAKRVEEDTFKRVVEMEPALKTLYDASAAWLQRDDHWGSDGLYTDRLIAEDPHYMLCRHSTIVVLDGYIQKVGQPDPRSKSALYV